ncbi:MAG: dTDP-4-dehydrorhamnose reductase [Verrucomicrobiota bacterium]|nr:dTDP-4-dehydrorhamnose reductase [Verrucomicrobiota bacterium]
MKLWITGGRGLVGAALCEIAPKPFVISGHEIDIADLDACRAFAKENGPITHIVNCAAFSQVDPAETQRKEAFRANAIGPEVLGFLAREIDAHFLHISTDYVFPGTGHVPLKESDAVAPCNYYGLTKLEGEKAVQSVNPKACILRTSAVFGKGGKNFIAKLFDLLQTKETLRFSNDQMTRFTYAPDLAQVILSLLNQSGLYQFANAGPATKYEFACAFRQEMERQGFPVRCKHLEPAPSSEFPAAAKRPMYTVFDTSKLEQRLHIHPRPWQTCLKEYIHAHTH